MKRYWSIMISVGFLLGAAMFLLSTSPGGAARQAQTEGDRSLRTVSVSGAGQVEAQPDMAVVRVGVETEAEQANAALTQNSQQMQAVITALEEAGLAAEAIRTETVQLQPQYEQPSSQPPGDSQELTGYRATNIVEARVSNLDNLGQLLDQAVQAGGNRIEGIRFEVSDPTQPLEQARAAAWEDARSKAEQLVELAGTELDEVWSVREFDATPRPVRSGMAQEAAAASPIEPGSQTIQVRLEVVWLLP